SNYVARLPKNRSFFAATGTVPCISRQLRDHLRKWAGGAIGCISQAKVLENLEQSLLLIEETDVFSCPVHFTKQSAADDRQTPIAKLGSNFLVSLPIALI